MDSFKRTRARPCLSPGITLLSPKAQTPSQPFLKIQLNLATPRNRVKNFKETTLGEIDDPFDTPAGEDDEDDLDDFDEDGRDSPALSNSVGF